MLLLSIILSVFTACEKSPETMSNINGNWGLIQTKLYENGELNGSAFSNEVTTIYTFTNCQQKSDKSELTIEEDGEKEVYNCIYNKTEKLFILGQINLYHIEVLTDLELVFYKEYGTYKSQYIFSRID